MTDYLLALDQGTTSSRAILFTRQGSVVSSAQIPFSQYYPQPGWVEHDPLELLDSQLRAAAQCVAQSGVRPGQIAGVGLANQRETALMWERETGKPVGRAIVWQCRRTAAFCTQLREQGYTEAIRGPDRAAAGRLFLRHQIPVAAGAHPRRPAAGGAGRAALRYGGQLAAVESHRGKGPCLGLLQLLPDHAL